MRGAASRRHHASWASDPRARALAVSRAAAASPLVLPRFAAPALPTLASSSRAHSALGPLRSCPAHQREVLPVTSEAEAGHASSRAAPPLIIDARHVLDRVPARIGATLPCCLDVPLWSTLVAKILPDPNLDDRIFFDTSRHRSRHPDKFPSTSHRNPKFDSEPCPVAMISPTREDRTTTSTTTV